LSDAPNDELSDVPNDKLSDAPNDKLSDAPNDESNDSFYRGNQYRYWKARGSSILEDFQKKDFG